MSEYDFSPILARLKATKKKSGMTNEELSAASGVPIGTLKKIFSGDTKEPKLPALMSIASALNTSVDYLVYGDSEKNKPVANVDDRLDEIDMQIVGIVRTLSHSQKAFLLAQLQTLQANQESMQ